MTHVTYAEYKAEVIKLVKGHYLKVWPEAEVDEFLRNEEAWITESYNSYTKKDPKYFESCTSGLAQAMGLAF